ncbi:DUF2500 family protein [Longirhabdus pacifica]|uniref:DUF2500 family protein n=1 Tax=Longirhabdus pacifica TaxID=2305227 RepID=UPI0013E8AF0E|nr:DUF2500 family protein [Longirhabdus pacifica]
MEPSGIISNIFLFIFFAVISIFILIFVYGIFSNLKQARHNFKQPVLTIPTTIVAKRTKVNTTAHRHRGDTHRTINGTYTNYYVTFEDTSGGRVEFLNSTNSKESRYINRATTSKLFTSFKIMTR